MRVQVRDTSRGGARSGTGGFDAKAALAKAVRFIESKQRADGLWEDFETRSSGRSTLWVSGYICHAIQTAANADSPAARSCRQALLAGQQESGGWGYNAAVPADADSTAFCVLALCSSEDDVSEAVLSGLAFLDRCQRPDGGFATYPSEGELSSYRHRAGEHDYSGWCASHVEVTAVCLLALLAARPDMADGSIQRPVQFLLDRQRPERVWDSYWWRGPLYATCWAAVALSAAGVAMDRRRETALHDWLARNQRPDGGWSNGLDHGGCPFCTALACVALSHLTGADQSVFHRGISYLSQRQLDDGSWAANHLTLQVPPPSAVDAGAVVSWHLGCPGVGGGTRDPNRLFTTATVVTALVVTGQGP
jgi:squalene cyclase